MLGEKEGDEEASTEGQAFIAKKIRRVIFLYLFLPFFFLSFSVSILPGW